MKSKIVWNVISEPKTDLYAKQFNRDEIAILVGMTSRIIYLVLIRQFLCRHLDHKAIFQSQIEVNAITLYRRLYFTTFTNHIIVLTDCSLHEATMNGCTFCLLYMCVYRQVCRTCLRIIVVFSVCETRCHTLRKCNFSFILALLLPFKRPVATGL